MSGNHNTPRGMGLNAGFGILWLDSRGKRYCNETFGDPVFAGFPGNQLKRGTFYSLFDSGILRDLEWAVPAHYGFDEAWEENVTNLKQNMDRAVKAGAGGYERAATIPGGAKAVMYAGATIDDLLDNASITGGMRSCMIESFNRYNEICRLGRDEDFGKDAKLLRPLESGPLFMEPFSFDVGWMLVTVGGLLTDESQNVLDMAFDVIPGLYATGNCCGRRFGPQYSTPIPGVSIGIAICLGREAGIAATRG